MLKILLTLFITIPIAEIIMFLVIGEIFGVFLTLFFILLTAIIGALLVKQQGIATLFKIKKELQNNKNPNFEILEGIFLLIAGLLLLTPGFFTDTIGFLFIYPKTRMFLVSKIIKNKNSRTNNYAPDDDAIIEAEFKVVNDKKKDN